MKLKIQVIKDNSKIEIFEGVSAKTGKPYKMINQEVYAQLGGAFPEKLTINLPDENSVLPAGDYELSVPFRSSDRNKLEIDDRAIFDNIKPAGK